MNLFTNLFTMRRVSMREIAKEAGVSLATVSYALRGSGKIPEKTRDRITTLAKKMGYQADPSFAVLGARRWEHRSSYNGLSIAYVAAPRSQWTAFQKSCFNGCREQAQLLGYHLQHFCLEDFKSPAHMGEVLEMRAFNGVIFRRINNQKDIEGFPFHLFSIIACGRGYVDPHCHLVIPHHQHDLNRCWQHLREKGHSRIGCILLEKNPLAELPEFYIGALLQAQLDVVKKDRIPFFLCKEHEPAALHKWIQRWQPQGIIGCVEYIHGWLSNYKNILSHRIDFTCLEKLNLKQQDIEGIDLRPQLMGKITIDQLDRAIRANERGLPKIRHTIHIESTWSANAASTHKS